MEPERQRHIGIPASTSNRVAVIAGSSQGVARAAGHFAARCERAPNMVYFIGQESHVRRLQQRLATWQKGALCRRARPGG
jgi:hypothetical protein